MITFFILLGIAVALGGVIVAMTLISSKNKEQPAETPEITEVPEPVAEPEEELPAETPEEQPEEEQTIIVEVPVVVEETVIVEQPEEQPEEEPVEEPEEQPVEEPEVIEEPVVAEEPEPVVLPIPVIVAEEEEEDEVEEEEEEEITQLKPVILDGKTRYIIIKYSKSFLAKLIQSEDVTKNYYEVIKNTLLSYKGVKSRISWRWETFRSGRKALAKLRLRGKTLSLTLALNAADYAGTKYIVEDKSEVKSCADTPCLYRIKNDRRLKYSADLIADVMKANGLELNPKAENIDYAAQYPYETTGALIERKLIKELTDEEAQSGTQFKPRKSVTVQEADSLMEDEIAVTYVQKAEEVATPAAPAAAAIKRNKGSDRTKCGIVNIDTLSKYFEDGETVTLEEMIKRIPEINKKTTYIKVLARGTLDKRLTIYADSYSIQAVKMIVLTGGTPIKN